MTNLQALCLRHQGFSRWDYFTTDDITQVLRSGYFNRAFSSLRQNDLIDVVCRRNGEPVFVELWVEKMARPDVVVDHRAAKPGIPEGRYVPEAA